MFNRRVFSKFFPLILLGVLVWSPSGSISQQNARLTQTDLVAGRNVNMVSGTTLPYGDPWLQRQNEPSIAVSTRNPLHLLAGANDYRTVDMPTSEGELPGNAANSLIAAGDAWLGVFQSIDRGESWTSTMLPGYPQDSSGTERGDSLKPYNAAADPVVRAGTNGMFYFSGITFKRTATGESGDGAVFVARFIDNNNIDNDPPIRYIDTHIIDKGNSGQFIDKPWIAVDIPRSGAATIPITLPDTSTQSIPAGNVFIAYSRFTGSSLTNKMSAVYFSRSADLGGTWSNPIKLSEGEHINQGAVIAVDPQNGNVYVAWRRFKKDTQPDAIIIAKSTDGGKKFGKSVVVAAITPFDQGSSPATIRSNSYPVAAIDDQGYIHLAWTARGYGSFNDSRIVISSSNNGSSWSTPRAVDNHGGRGHQFMPSLVYTGGQLMMAWYDARNDASGDFSDYIVETQSLTGLRHTVDVWTTTATPGSHPEFGESIQVSRYLFALVDPTRTADTQEIYQVQFNPVNYPLFKGGTQPFHGDYVDLAPSPMFVLKNGAWRFNTDASDAPVYHVAWTDNRDVRPPADNNWTNYIPPTSFQAGNFPSPAFGACDPDKTGMRNQNIYTAAVTKGITIGSPRNAKPLGGLGTYSDGQIPRTFIVFVKNATSEIKSFRFAIAGQPTGGTASFLEFSDLSSLDVAVAPNSEVARSVFVTSTSPAASVTVQVTEIYYPGGNTVPGGFSGLIVLNADSSNPDIPGGDSLSYKEVFNPNIINPNIINPNIINPNIINWDYANPNIINPNIINPNIINPNIINPNIINPNIINPNIINPNIINPNIINPNIINPNIINPNIINPNIINPNIINAADVVWEVENNGNTYSTYTVRTMSTSSIPAGIDTQLLIYRIHYTPQTGGADCRLKQEPHFELVASIANPNIINPNIINPNIINPNIINPNIINSTFYIGPGESAIVDLRVIDPNPSQAKMMANGQAFSLTNFVNTIDFAATSHAVDSQDVAAEKKIPKFDTTALFIGTFASLPDATVGAAYSAALSAAGGSGNYTWSLNSGDLPAGLSLSSTGVIIGTPTSANVTYPYTYRFVLEVSDGSSSNSQEFYITVYSTAPSGLSILTASSLPDAVVNAYYGLTLEAVGGTWPRSWNLVSGSLPPGLTFDTAGAISGIPTATGTNYSFTLQVTDSSIPPLTMNKSFLLNVIARAAASVTISGICYNPTGSPLQGVLMHGLPDEPMTDAAGFYTASVPSGWSGTVTPFITGCTFTPFSRTYSGIITSQTGQNYNDPSGVAAKLAFKQQPSNTAVNTIIAPPVTVEIQDALGNKVATATNTVTIVFNPQLGGISGTLSRPAVAGLATFNDLKIDTVGTAFTLGADAAALTSATSNSFNIVALVASQIRVETKADGTGTIVPPQSLPAGSSLTVYAVSRTAGGIYIDNVAADSWSIINGTGGIAASDLVEAPDHESAVMTGHGPGTCNIRAVKAGLTSVDSGLLTVIEGYVFVTKWGDQGNQPGQFNRPTGIAVDGSGSIYVADSSNSRVQKFTSSGTFVTQWGSSGIGNGQFSGLEGITVDSCGHVYVADIANNRFQKFTSSGVFEAKWGTYGSGDGQLNFPRGIAVDNSGNIYVVDQGNSRVQKFNSAGAYVTKWGSAGSGDGQFSSPREIEIDFSGFIYVTDAGNHRIQKFDSNGMFLGWWGRDDLGNTGWHNPQSGRIGSPGSGDGQLYDPWGIAVDSSGYVYVSDQANNRVQKFTPSGAFITKWGTPGSGDGQFNLPFGIAVDGFAGVYVTDNSHRIQKFRRVETNYISVETAADGSGIVIPNQVIPVGSSITVYAVSRSASGNFLGNVVADSWTLVNMCGGVVGGDLVPAGGNCAVFTAHLAGSADIHVAKAGFVSVDSGLLTVSAQGYTVSGTVYYSTTPQDGIKTDLMQGTSPTWTQLQTTTTANGGAYSFAGVASGSYHVRVNGPTSEYIGWTARTITVSNGAVVQNMDLPKLLTLVSPPSGTVVGTANPTLTWNANPQAASYTLQLNKTSGWELIGQWTGLTLPSFQVPTALTSGVNYTWQVDAYGNGHWVGTTSNQFNFTVSIVIPAAVKLAFTQSPGGGIGGQAWAQQPIVQVQDANSQLVTSDNSTQVTLLVKNNPGNGSLTGVPQPVIVTVSGGIATFNGLGVDKGGWNYTLEAREAVPTSSLQPATSEPFNIEGFSSRASMSEVRGFHTATYLTTDKILIAGGERPGTGFLNTAELYDPANNSYASLPNMNDLRGEHTATTLLDGRVLITGGGGGRATAELFNPGTGTFTPTTGTMNLARIDHRASRLQDGRVLITGGSTPSDFRADLYDPSLGTFTFTGAMCASRFFHTSTWLPNGKVLIAGGRPSGGGAPTATAELYDPDTGTFVPIAGGMTSARYSHAATLLNNGTVLITGGSNGASAVNTAEIYNPATNSFAAIGLMNFVHMGHQAMLLRNSAVLVFGVGQAEIYDPGTSTFRLTGESARGTGEGVRQDGAAAETADGLVFVCGGGYNYSGQLVATTEIWNPLQPFPTRVISGHVRNGANGVAGVLMTGLPGYPVTDLDGYYEGVVMIPWTGTVTPTKSGYTFNPTSIPYTGVIDNTSGQDYSVASMAGAVSGRVTYGGNGVADVSVYVNKADFSWVMNATTDSSGYYTVSGLETGDYKVYFVPPTSTWYVQQWFNGKFMAAADVIHVAAGATTAVNVTLAVGGKVSGRVTNTNGVGIPNIDVQLRTTNNVFQWEDKTDSNGEYSISAAAGTYLVYFNPYPSVEYAEQWYNGSPTVNTATSVTIVNEGATSGIHATLAGAVYKISGRATTSGYGTSLRGVTLQNLTGSLPTDSSGNYLSGNLQPHANITVVPAKTGGWTFSPPQIAYSNIIQNYSNQDYLAIPPPTGPFFLIEPNDTVVNTAMSAVSVIVRDGSGNVIPGATVTLEIGNNPGGATPFTPAVSAVATSSGRATFSGMVIDRAGSGYTLKATWTLSGFGTGTFYSMGFTVFSY